MCLGCLVSHIKLLGGGLISFDHRPTERGPGSYLCIYDNYAMEHNGVLVQGTERGTSVEWIAYVDTLADSAPTMMKVNCGLMTREELFGLFGARTLTELRRKGYTLVDSSEAGGRGFRFWPVSLAVSGLWLYSAEPLGDEDSVSVVTIRKDWN